MEADLENCFQDKFLKDTDFSEGSPRRYLEVINLLVFLFLLEKLSIPLKNC